MTVRPDQPIKIVFECIIFCVFLLVDQFCGGALNVAVRPDQPIKIVFECIIFCVFLIG